MIENNTTWDLIDDIEKLRISLNIKRWHVYGQSWGTTLGLIIVIEYITIIFSINKDRIIGNEIKIKKGNNFPLFYTNGA